MLRGDLNRCRAVLPSLLEPRGPVEVPTTLLRSSGDIALGRKQAELAERFVHAPYEFVDLGEVSHWIPDQKPAELAEVVSRRVRSVRA